MNLPTINKVKKAYKTYEPIKIIEPFKPETVEFPTAEEFTVYYRNHPEEFAGMSTYKLNLRFMIPGYKITQPKTKNEEEESSELRLIKDYRSPINAKSTVENKDDRIHAMEERITELTEKVNQLTNEVNNITQYLQQN